MPEINSANHTEMESGRRETPGTEKSIISRIREQHPLIHIISNTVTLNDVVNISLAAGATAICANAPEETEEITAIANGLLLNTGTPSSERVKAMLLSGRKANALGIPVVLDPVGAGASRFRTEFIKEFLEEIRFDAAVELAVAMPLSWLPLISDYTREVEEPKSATLASVVTYGIISCWMYFIGMGAAIYTGESDIALVMAKAGLGVAALVILVLSTVTTTFLDAWSAGISSESLSGKLTGKMVAIIVTIVGIAGALLFNMDDITDFLYLIGSVFAPMIAIQIADYFILRARDDSEKSLSISRIVIWVIGFILYRVLMTVDTPLGNTCPDMILTIIITVLWGRFAEKNN